MPVGQTVPTAEIGIELARDRLRRSYFNRSVINAEMFEPQEAVKAGFLDAVVAPEELMPAALAMAEQMKKLKKQSMH